MWTQVKRFKKLLSCLAVSALLVIAGCDDDAEDDDESSNTGGGLGLLDYTVDPQPVVAEYVLTLDGASQVPPNDSPATGTAELTLFESGRLTGTVTFDALTTDATLVYIQRGGAGEEGPAITLLVPTFSDRNTWVVPFGTNYSQDSIDLMTSGQLYINVMTGSYPDGEIRAQIAPPE